MIQTIPETEPTEREAFHITTEEAANWYLRKQANIEAEKQRVKAQAEAIVSRLNSDAESLRHLYEAELQEFVRTKLAESGNRRKSVHFLQGTAQFRTVPTGVRITDPVAALDYAKAHLPDAVRVTETLDGQAYRAAIDATGELLPGVLVEPERESFTLSFGKPKTPTE